MSEKNNGAELESLKFKYAAQTWLICSYYESIHLYHSSGSSAIRGVKKVDSQKVAPFSLCGYFSLLFPWPTTFASFLLKYLFTFIMSFLWPFSSPCDRAVPCAMWQPWCLLRGPVSVWGGLDWRRVRPESMPSSLRGTWPVPRRDLHLSARLGGGALQHRWALCVCARVY